GELALSKGYGLANVAEARPITPRTVFRIGSVSKTITAIGLMRLWEAGHFQLDDPVNDYLKAFRVEHPDPNASPVTFRHLLTHSDYRRTDRVQPQLALGYKVRRGATKAVTDRDIVHPGAGSVYSSVEDMGNYMAALTSGGSNSFGQVLKPETLELMFRPQFSL